MIFLDFETRSELNISGKQKHVPVSSVYDYARHSSTEILCVAYAFDTDPVEGFAFRRENDTPKDLLGPGRPGRGDDPRLLEPLLERVRTGEPIVAHNAGFEREMWEGYATPVLGFPPVEQWLCSSALCGHFGLPLSLEDAASVLGIKGKFDNAAMKKTCSPSPAWYRNPAEMKWRGTRADFDDLLVYCMQDVEVARNVAFRCPALGPDLDVWNADQEINRRGVYIDRDLVDKCAEIAERVATQAAQELALLTSGFVNRPTQAARIKQFLNMFQVHVESCQADELETELAKPDLDPIARKVIDLRLAGAGAAIKKFPTLASLTSPDGYLRGAYVYCGARTGRWVSRGAQLQNPIKPAKEFDPALIDILVPEVLTGDLRIAETFGTPREILSSMVRAVMCAAPGKLLVSLDYSAIEARVTAWLAGERRSLAEFRALDDGTGPEPYVVMAQRINAHDPNRSLGKCAVLGLGFGMGAARFGATCQEWHIPVEAATVARTVEIYRATYPRIVAFWREMEDGFKCALRRPGHTFPVGRLSWQYIAAMDVLALRLPSGRRLYYHHPQVHHGKQSYVGRLGQEEQGAIGRVYGWGGKWTENAVQGAAADVQRHAIVSLDKYLPEAPVVLHSHDEVVTEAREADAERVYIKQKALMVALSEWGNGLPIDAAGWIGRRYRKD